MNLRATPYGVSVAVAVSVLSVWTNTRKGTVLPAKINISASSSTSTTSNTSILTNDGLVDGSPPAEAGEDVAAVTIKCRRVSVQRSVGDCDEVCVALSRPGVTLAIKKLQAMLLSG